uniref:Uncharacterized protein n=1 Tax=Phytophthora ramorum TaxID=164328 RepID=H3GY86_PHYRM
MRSSGAASGDMQVDAGVKPPDPEAADDQAPKAENRTEAGNQHLSQDSIVEETQQSQSTETREQEEDQAEGPAGEATSHSGLPPTEDLGGKPSPQEPARTDTIAPAAAARHRESEAQPQELFDAIVAAIQAAPNEPPHAAWTETITLLFAKAHDSVKIDEELVPASKQRYPKLRQEEQDLLYDFFNEACILSKNSYAQWDRLVHKITQDLYNTKWSFKHILQNMTSSTKWARITPLNQWAAKVKVGRSPDTEHSSPQAEDIGYLDYMFNPAVYSKDDMAKLSELCLQQQSGGNQRRLREGTKDEWRIISGLAEGTIVSRKTPPFLRSVLDSRERLRLYKTIQAQVEGELVMKLRNGTGIRLTRQSTSSIKEDILLAAEQAHVNQNELRTMLNVTKTISYNYVRRSIHFFFFDRATARKHELTTVPFKRTIYRLANAHIKDTRSVWARQFDRNGVRTQNQQEYEIEIRNVTRFTDIGRLTAYLAQHIQADIDFEDMDICTPDSRTSTLRGAGSRIAAEADVAELEDLGRPFTSMKEVKETAEKRLQLQIAKEKHAKEAVQPLQPPKQRDSHETQATDSRTEPTTMKDGISGQGNPAVEPKPKQHWVTKNRPNGTKLYAHPDALRRRELPTSSRFAVFEEEEEEKDAEVQPTDQPDVEEISSGSEQEEHKPPPISASAKAKLHLIRDKPNKELPTPQLVALKQRERMALATALEPTTSQRGVWKSLEPTVNGKDRTFASIQKELGIRPVATPSSGNCMAMALAQALADQDLAGNDRALERLGM